MTQLFVNNLVVKLASGIDNISNTIAVENTTSFPIMVQGDWFYLTLSDKREGGELRWEVVKVTSYSANTLTVIRAQGDTTAQSWSVGSELSLRVTAADMFELEAFKDSKGQVNGLAPLDSSSQVPVLNIPNLDASKLTSGVINPARYVAADLLTKIKTVDGASSGLDADLLDGLNSTQFLRSDASGTLTGALSVTNNIALNNGAADSPGIHFHNPVDNNYVENDLIGANYRAFGAYNGGANFDVFSYDLSTKTYKVFDNTVWHAGNDGAGSGLDADLLDGSQGADYAKLASPSLTGVPTAPTAAVATNTTQIATTAFVEAATTPSQLLTDIKTVDGANSGLDADLLDGLNSTQFLRSDTSGTLAGTLSVTGRVLASQGTGSTGGYSFTDEGTFDSGMFSPSDGVLDLYANAQKQVSITSNVNILAPLQVTGNVINNITFNNGAADSPGIHFHNPVNNTYAENDLTGANYRAFGSYNGGANFDVFSYDLSTKTYKVFDNTVWHDGLGAKSFSTSGYQKLPSGLIIQWGQISHVVGTNIGDTTSTVFTFPIAFPNGALNVTVANSGGGDEYLENISASAYTSNTSTNISSKRVYGGNSSVPVSVSILAIGF